MVFVGVTTGGSLINRIFPVWAEIMGIAPARHRGPGSLDRPLRCGPLTVRHTAARTAPDGRSREPGQMGHYQCSLVSARLVAFFSNQRVISRAKSWPAAVAARRVWS